MQNTLFNRNRNLEIPNLDTVDDKVLVDNGRMSFYVANEVAYNFLKSMRGITTDITDLLSIIKATRIQGDILFMGNVDEDDGSFICFTTQKTYIMRFSGPQSGYAELRVAEKNDGKYLYEWNYKVYPEYAEEKLKIRIDQSEKKTEADYVKASYVYEGNICTVVLSKFGIHVNYDVILKCRDITDDKYAREEMETFFLNKTHQTSTGLYDMFMKTFEAYSVQERMVEFMKIDVSVDDFKVETAYYRNGVLQCVHFLRENSLWKLYRNGAWDYIEGNLTISWIWKKDRKKFKIVSTGAGKKQTLRKVSPSFLSKILELSKIYHDEFFGCYLYD